MNSDNTTYLFYDKKYKNQSNYNNEKTNNITIESLFSDDYKYLDHDNSILKFNELNSINQIDKNINKNIFTVMLFTNKLDSDLVITLISIDNIELEKFIKENESDINEELYKSTLDFISNISRFHYQYEKVRLNKKQDDLNKTVNDIINHVTNKVGDITDPIIENPEFLNCKLYDYQKRSVNWLSNIEKNVDKRILYYNINPEINFGSISYDIIKKKFITNNEKNKLVFKGGALIDEVGLGKTIQMTTVALLNEATTEQDINYYKLNDMYSSRATLIICPNQLCGQWDREIKKMVKKNLNIISILTKTHFEKYTYLDILDADFVIISNTFLENNSFVSEIIDDTISTKKNYLKSREFDFSAVHNKVIRDKVNLYNDPTTLLKTKVNLFAVNFRRLIVDELHEVFTVEKYKHIYNILPLFKADYKWCVTGTPFTKDPKCLYEMLNFVTDYSLSNMKDNILNIESVKLFMMNNFFRRNTKKSVEAEYKLKPLKETVIWLKFSQTERMMYNAFLANPNNDKYSELLRKICCHPKLADEIKDALSNCKTLDDIQKTMVNHYYNDMKKAETKLNLQKIREQIWTILTERYVIERIKRLLKGKHKVIVEYWPELNAELIKSLAELNNTAFDPNNQDDGTNINIDDLIKNNKTMDDVNNDDNDNDNKLNKKPEYKITKTNIESSITLIGASWYNNNITLNNYYENINKIKNKIIDLQKTYDGKKSTYTFYHNVMEKIKKTIDKKELKEKERQERKLKKEANKDNSDSDDDSDSDSDDDNEDDEICGICLGEIPESDIGITKCGHMFCYECIKSIIPSKQACPMCKTALKNNEISLISYEKKNKEPENKIEIKSKNELINKIGTKLANLIFYLKSTNEHVIIFSQWDDLLRQVGDVLDQYGINNVYCKGNIWQRDCAIKKFTSDNNIRVIMLSSDSAASGSNLTKASSVILLDPVSGSYEYRKNTEMQAIGRAYRMGQENQVNVVRFIIQNTIEEEIYNLNKQNDSKNISINSPNEPKIDVIEQTEDNIKLSNEMIKDIKEVKPAKPIKKIKIKKPVEEIKN